MTIPEITKNSRTQHNLTLEQFAQALCADIPGMELTKQAVGMWENGKSTPAYLFTLLVFMKYNDWRAGWARAVLNIIKPGLFK
jgi:transcriptional regulator with XRE-family HTH domain